MENLADNNRFIELFENFYDEIYMNKGIEKIEESKEAIYKDLANYSGYPTKSIFDIFKKKKDDNDNFDLSHYTAITNLSVLEKRINSDTLHDSNIYKSYMEIKKYLDDILSKPSQGFWTLWQFCQFIRWCEKVFIYKNDPEEKAVIYVDSEMCGDNREFVFWYNNVPIFIKLELIQKPYVKITESAYNEVITILVTRPYGKKMENKIVVINGETEFENDSDIYMINQINRYINARIWTTIDSIVSNMVPLYKDQLPKISVGFYCN